MSDTKQLFREANDEEEVEVTHIELFFDLVFVFAITRLSHHLLEHLSWHGAIESLILFAALWWVWIFTSWVTNWLDPERANVRLMLLAMMIGGLALSVSIPEAFGETGMVFACAYVAMQVGRTLFVVWASRGHDVARARNFLRIAVYFLLSAPFWLGGAYAQGDLRLALWAIALAIEYAAPFLNFRTPGLGSSKMADWQISGAHMAERCALFIIIALGEGVLVTGATFADLEPSDFATAAFITCFLTTAAMWWIYFDIGAKQGSEMIEAAPDTGRVARNAYTYLHMVIVAGIIVTAVSDGMMLKGPEEVGKPGYILVTFGGAILFLLGNYLFKWASTGRKIGPLSHSVGMAVLAALGIVGWIQQWTALALGVAAAAALILTATWEWLSLNGGWQRWTPWAGSLLSKLRRTG